MRGHSYFYPRSPCGERRVVFRRCSIAFIFLSTLSLRRATYPRCAAIAIQPFLSTLSLRRATQAFPLLRSNLPYFYPRSPCGERRQNIYASRIVGGISIHALLAESDPLTALPCSLAFLFLSTLSLRRATSRAKFAKHLQTDFYPRSPCGERPFHLGPALLFAVFLSTLSLRRATSYFRPHRECASISIHALLAESDGWPYSSAAPHPDFYPRSPCGERQTGCKTGHFLIDFYPRSPCGERPQRGQFVSIQGYYFYPRSPCGERLGRAFWPGLSL